MVGLVRRRKLILEIVSYLRRPFMGVADGGYIRIDLGTLTLMAFKDHVGLKLAGDNRYEEVVSTWISAYSRHVDLFVDVGANIGYHTITQAGNFKKVVAIEPNPRVFELLRDNIQRNRKENVECLNIGLSSSSTRLPFAEDAGSTGTAHFVTFADDSCLQVCVKAFDEVARTLPDLEQPSIMKVDVEGWELQVFEGMKYYIETIRPVIIFEWDGRIKPLDDFEKIRNVLGSGYDFFTLDAPRPQWASSKMGYVLWRLIFGYPAVGRLTAIRKRYYLGIAAIPRNVPSPVDLGLTVS